MRILRYLLLSVLLLPSLALAQVNVTGKNPKAFPGVPSGSCNAQDLAVNTANGNLYTCLNGSWVLKGGGGTGTGTVTSVATTAPITGGTITGTGTIACATCTVTVCSGSQALGTSAIASGAAATTVTKACTGLLTTDNIQMDFNSSPLAVTGYIPSASGILTILKWPTADTINISVVNNTASSITPGAITLNYRVTR